MITREALEEIGEYAFTALRGLVAVGGQVKFDSSLLPGAFDSLGAYGAAGGMGGGQHTPSAQILAIVKPAALAWIEVESSALEAMKGEDEEKGEGDDDNEEGVDGQQKPNGPEFKINRSGLEVDFVLTHKSYALGINAVSMLATNRPVYFRDSATCLARRAMDSPDSAPEPGDYTAGGIVDESGATALGAALNKAGAAAVRSQLRASCLTLLRNTLSVTAGGWDVLHRALSRAGMAVQATKALNVARRQAALKTAGRAARNRAALMYEWDNTASSAVYDERDAKRRRTADDALAKLREDRAARGLGRGIQLPPSMVDACELVLANLRHLPASRPPGGPLPSGRRPFTLDRAVDAVMTNGTSLSSDESRWYARDGGTAWTVEMRAGGGAGAVDVDGDGDGDGDGPDVAIFALDEKTLKAAGIAYEAGDKFRQELRGAGGLKVEATVGTTKDAPDADKARLYARQCSAAAADAFGRIVARSAAARSAPVADFGNRIAARLAWTLQGVRPSSQLRGAYEMALEVASVGREWESGEGKKRKKKGPLDNFVEDFPLVSSCLALDVTSSDGDGGVSGKASSLGGAGGAVGPSGPGAGDPGGASSAGGTFGALPGTPSCLANRILNEAYMESHAEPGDRGNGSGPTSDEGVGNRTRSRYDRSLDFYVSSVVRSSERANEKPNDASRKRVAALAASSIPSQLATLPSVTPSSLALASSLCDIEDITRRAAEASRKASQSTLAASAGLHAAKSAAEKRATQALLTLRDAAFQRSKMEVRRGAVNCAVGIAAGRLPASACVEDKALKLVMNVLFPKAKELANAVVRSATDELERAAKFAAESNNQILTANMVVMKKRGDSVAEVTGKDLLRPLSDEEKAGLEKVRKPVVLFMALCVRRPEIIKALMEIGSRPNVDILAKAIRSNMQKLARAVVTKYGAAKIALQVFEVVDETETPLFLTFLDSLVPLEGVPPAQDLIVACREIQSKRAAGAVNDGTDSKLDARFIIPVVSGMKRDELVAELPSFVASDDATLARALRRMSERLKKYALMYRDDDSPSLHGMTLCEQMVYLHRLDFAAVGLPQKRYLGVSLYLVYVCAC